MDERVPHDEVLRQSNERIINRGRAVRVIALGHFAGDTDAFAGSRTGRVAGSVHRKENPALHWFETVANVGQGTRGDDRQRVVEIPAFGLVNNVDRFDIFHDRIGHR